MKSICISAVALIFVSAWPHACASELRTVTPTGDTTASVSQGNAVKPDLLAADKYLLQLEKLMHWGNMPSVRMLSKTLEITGLHTDSTEWYTLKNSDRSSLWSSVEFQGTMRLSIECNHEVGGITVEQLRKKIPNAKQSSEDCSTVKNRPVLVYSTADNSDLISHISIIWWMGPRGVMPTRRGRPPTPVSTLPGKRSYFPFSFMKLPSGNWEEPWVEYSTSPPFWISRFNIKNDPDVELTISSDQYASAPDKERDSIFFAPPHELVGDEFQLFSEAEFVKAIHTEDFNGRRGLVKTIEYDGKKIYRVVINSNPDHSKHSVNFEMTFSAPAEKYDRYLDKVKEAFHTIRWRRGVIYEPDSSYLKWPE